MKKLYLILAGLGIILPYSQFVPWTNANGFDVGGMVSAMFANQIAAGVSLDALLAAVIVIIFIALEQKRVKVSHLWLPIVGMFAVGLAFALPCYFFLRECALEKRS